MNNEVWNALVSQRNMEYAMHKNMREYIDKKYEKGKNENGRDL